MAGVTKFFRIFFNCVGLSCYVIQSDILQISNAIALKNALTLLIILSVDVYFDVFIDLTVFLPDGQSLMAYTSFTVTICRLIGVIPLILSGFIILNHLLKRQEILGFLKNLSKFDKKFREFAVCGAFTNTIKYQAVTMLIFLTFMRLLPTLLMLKLNMIVIISYLMKFYCDYTFIMFLLILSIVIKYIVFVVKNFNRRLEECLRSNRAEELEEFLVNYESIWKLLSDFDSIFQLQISVLVSCIFAKLVFLVNFM